MILTAALIAAGLLWTVLVGPHLTGLTRPYRWWICDDVWVPLRPAGFVVDGALPYLYDGDAHYVYPPGLALLYAPVVAIGRWLSLSDSGGVAIPRPTIWFVLAPLGLGLSVTVLASLRAYVWQSGARARLALVQAAVALVAIVPIAIVWGHFEDSVVLATLLAALVASRRGRWLHAAGMLSIGLLFKQTALLAVPVLFIDVPRRDRVRWMAIALGPVAGLCALALAFDPAVAGRALFAAKSFPATGRAALWAQHGDAVVSTPIRAVAVAAAIGVAWIVRGRTTTSAGAGALALVLLLRILVEPVAFPYYLGVPVALLVAATTTATRTGWVALVLGAVATVTFIVPAPALLWWPLFAVSLGGLLLLATQVVRASDDDSNRPAIARVANA